MKVKQELNESTVYYCIVWVYYWHL